MCLFVIDGTWSRDFNSKALGNDVSGKPVGNLDLDKRSNSRRFYEECALPLSKKFYYGGPRFGVTGADARSIYMAVMAHIEKEIVSGNCQELSLVGWSRGAAVVSEVAQGLMNKEFARIYKTVSSQTRRGIRYTTKVDGQADMIPSIKFVGLFDSVAMIPFSSGTSATDKLWGEAIPKEVAYLVHVVAGDRKGPIPGIVDFIPAAPKVAAAKSFTVPIPCANHGDIGGFSTSPRALAAYKIMKSHAIKAGLQ